MITHTVYRMLSTFGRIDILVNNAGVNVPKLAVDVTPEDWDAVLDTRSQRAVLYDAGRCDQGHDSARRRKSCQHGVDHGRRWIQISRRLLLCQGGCRQLDAGARH